MNTFEGSFEKKEKRGKKEQLELLINKIREKFPSLERVVEKGSRIIKILSIIAFLSSSGEVMAQNVEFSKDKDKSLDDIETLLGEDIKVIHSELESLKKSLDRPSSFSSFEKEDKEGVKQDIQGSLSIDDNGLIGDIAIIQSTRKIDREKDGQLENLFTNSIEISSQYSESDIEGLGDYVRGSGLGGTREQAILNALEELSSTSSVEVFAATSSQHNESSDDFLNVVALDGCNYFEDAVIVSELQSGQGEDATYEVIIEAEKGQLQENRE